MKFKEHVNIKQIGDEAILVSNDAGNLNYTRVISLNESAEYLVRGSMDKNFTPQDWTDKLVEKYGIDKEQAADDVQALVDVLVQAGVLYK